MAKELFQMALNVTDPWFVSDLKFDVESKRLNIYIDFKKGSTFCFFEVGEDKEIVELKAYGTTLIIP
jgi:hypothetical protein